MKKYRQYEVGDIMLRVEDNKFIFDGTYCAKAPAKIILAMMVLGNYLHWYNVREMYGRCRENIPPVTQSYSGRTVYVGHKPVMKICSTGNSDWAEMTRYQLLGAINESLEHQNYMLIPEVALDLVSMLRVKRVEDKVLFSKEEYQKSDELFRAFLKERCKEVGEYRIPVEEFKKRTGLPTKEMILEYLHFRWLYFRENGMELESSSVNETEVWLRFGVAY